VSARGRKRVKSQQEKNRGSRGHRAGKTLVRILGKWDCQGKVIKGFGYFGHGVHGGGKFMQSQGPPKREKGIPQPRGDIGGGDDRPL